MTVTPMSPHLMLEAELLEDGDSEGVVVGGVYGTVDDDATRYVPLPQWQTLGDSHGPIGSLTGRPRRR